MFLLFNIYFGLSAISLGGLAIQDWSIINSTDPPWVRLVALVILCVFFTVNRFPRLRDAIKRLFGLKDRD